MGDKPVRVILVDLEPPEDPQVQRLLAEPGTPAIELQSSADMSEAMQAAAEGRIDAILIGSRLWRNGGVDALDWVRYEVPAAAIVVLLDEADPTVIRLTRRRGAGAVGGPEGLTRQVLADAIEQAIQEAGARPADRPEESAISDPPRLRDTYRAIVEVQTDLICRFGLDGRLTFVSGSFAAFFAKQPMTLIGCRFLDLLPGEDRRVAEQHVALLDADTPIVSYEIRGLPSEEKRWLQWLVRAIFDEQGRHVEYQAVARDITELHTAREAIIEAVSFAAEQFFGRPPMSRHIQQFLKRLGKAAGTSRAYLFRKHVDADLRPVISQVAEWCAPGVTPQIDNPLLQEMPWNPERPDGTAAMLVNNRVLHGSIRQLPDDERDFLAAQGIISMAIVPITIEDVYWGHIGFDDCRIDRRWAPSEIDALRAAANIIGAAVQREHHESALQRARDQLEERVAERTAELQTAVAELRNSEETARAILNAATEVACLIDSGGVLLAINEEGPRRLGLTPEEMIGKSIFSFFPPDVGTRRQAQAESVFRTGKPARFSDERAGMHFEHSYFPIFDAQGKVTRVAAFVRDTTKERNLEKHVLQISAREQRRIGFDLHDGLCQQLAGIALLAQSQYQKCQSECGVDTTGLQRIVGLLEESLVQARSLARGLQPVAAEVEGLMMALEQLADTTESFYGIACRFEPAGSVPVDDPDVATHLYRIAQEAVSNAVRHSQCRDVTIHLSRADGLLSLTVTDDGMGLPDTRREGAGMGLDIMRYRARVIGGYLEMRAEDGGGTTVRCSLNVPADSP